MIYDLYDFSRSCTYVSNKLNEKGYVTRSGSKWNPATIHIILTNPFYCGVYRYNMHYGLSGPERDKSEWVVVNGHHEGLISKERFDRIQYVMQKNKRGGNQRGISVKRKNEHIFAGLLQCGVCGSNMTATPGKGRTDGWSPSNYGCYNRRKGPSECASKFVSDISVAPFVIQYLSNMMKCRSINAADMSFCNLSKILLNEDVFSDVQSIEQDGLAQFKKLLESGAVGLEFSPKSLQDDEPQLASEREELEEQRRKYTTAMSRLKSLYLYGDDELPEKDFLLERKRILDAINDIDAKLSQFEGADVDYDDDFSSKASYFIMVQAMMGDHPLDSIDFIRSIDPAVIKSFLNTVLDKIVITNGKITSIHFKNGMVHKFCYK